MAKTKYYARHELLFPDTEEGRDLYEWIRRQAKKDMQTVPNFVMTTMLAARRADEDAPPEPTKQSGSSGPGNTDLMDSMLDGV